ncbi:MAG: histidine phosphatase family protein [Patescibacteria group bacterium]|nr:histidine phosphatase family protein [Patescibacteria group bacterium]
MLQIYLTRHGQDEDNAKGLLNGQRDTDLTETGISQARELALKIRENNIQIDYIYSSPLRRAFHTAQIADSLLGGTKGVFASDDLKERDFGIMTGRSKGEIETFCSPNLLSTETVLYFLKPEGGETYPELIKRTQRILRFIKFLHFNENVLVVSHGDTAKMLYASYYNLDWKKTLQMFHVGNADLIMLSEESPVEETHMLKMKQYNN